MPISSHQKTPSAAALWTRLLRLGFRLLYREMAWTYDLVAWVVSLGRWRAWTQLSLDHVQGPRILELGHGPGHVLVSLHERGHVPVGLDISPQMSRLAHQRLRRAGHPLRLVRAQAQALPFANEAFSDVVATFPTAYIVAPSTQQEIARVLQPNGNLVIVMGARLLGRDPLTRVIEWLYRITGQRESEDVDDWIAAFHQAGVSPSPLRVEMRGSQVFLLVGQKDPASP
jgi:ubiquinone/menaquinone biosynthesis C-methylase UbiE